MPVFRQLKDSPSALIEWVGEAEREAWRHDNNICVLFFKNTSWNGIFIQDREIGTISYFAKYAVKTKYIQYNAPCARNTLIYSMRKCDISVRWVRQNPSLWWIAVSLNYLHRLTLTLIEKCLIQYLKNGGKKVGITKDNVLYESRDDLCPFFDCSETLLGHPQCGVGWRRWGWVAPSEQQRGRGETSRQIAPSARLCGSETQRMSSDSDSCFRLFLLSSPPLPPSLRYSRL